MRLDTHRARFCSRPSRQPKTQPLPSKIQLLSSTVPLCCSSAIQKPPFSGSREGRGGDVGNFRYFVGCGLRQTWRASQEKNTDYNTSNSNINSTRNSNMYEASRHYSFCTIYTYNKYDSYTTMILTVTAALLHVTSNTWPPSPRSSSAVLKHCAYDLTTTSTSRAPHRAKDSPNFSQWDWCGVM